MVIFDLSAAFDTVNYDILLTMFKTHLGIDRKVIKWFGNYVKPRYFKVCIDGHYSSSKELKFSVPQGSCSGDSVFTCYCALITDIIPDTISINGFADNHSIRKKYKASNRNKEIRIKEELETTVPNIKNWMDTMHLKLNSDKTEYITFGLRQQLQKLKSTPLNANCDHVNLRKVVTYLGSYLDQTISFKGNIKKTKKAMVNLIKRRSIRIYLTANICTTVLLMLCIPHLYVAYLKNH